MNFIEPTRELTESGYVIQMLIDSGWIEKDMIIVNCSPRYSSRLAQLVNHKTSFLNNNELYEQINLELPLEGTNQVWCYDEKEYLLFDKYLHNWVRKHVIFPTNKYLFVVNTMFTGRNLNKVRLEMKNKVELDKFAFLSLNVCSESILKPDFSWKQFDKNNPPVFFWENKNK